MDDIEVNFTLNYDGARIVAEDGTFLGKITTNKFDAESILNQFGQYGNQFNAHSLFNTFGNYGSTFSAMSPFNPFSATPPKILKNGRFVAYLTKNKTKIPGIDPDLLVGWLQKRKQP